MNTIRPAGTTPTASPQATNSTGTQFNANEYLETQLTEGKGANFVKAMGESYGTAFDKNVRDAVQKLGPNATQAQVDKAISAETSKQMVIKSVIDNASKMIMNKIKEISSDTFTAE